MIGLAVEEFTNSRGRDVQLPNIDLVNVTKMFSTISSQNTPPPFAYYFEAKKGKGYLLKYSISICIRPLNTTRFVVTRS